MSSVGRLSSFKGDFLYMSNRLVPGKFTVVCCFVLQHRRLLKAEATEKYKSRLQAKEIFKERKKQEAEEMTGDPLEEIFHEK